MIPKCERYVPTSRRYISRPERRENEDGVSEVLGVIMMLAMVVTIMGGVWVFLNPYISDFEDNTNWNAANGIADRLEDRIDVASDAPEGTGIRHNLQMRTSLLQGVSNLEHWTKSADLTPSEVVNIGQYSNNSFVITSTNDTAAKVTIITETSEFTQLINVNSGLVEHNMQLGEWYIITVFNENDDPIHRSVKYSLSGLRLITSLGLSLIHI